MKPWRITLLVVLAYGGCTAYDHYDHLNWPGRVHTWPQSMLATAAMFGFSVGVTIVFTGAILWASGMFDRKKGP
jgi:hypothetical protein